MQKIINGAVFQVNLNGKSSSEFKGDHPSIIVQTLKLKDLYYIIPLTTYTKERWKDYKDQFGCRIKSTGSIALVSKMQVRHKWNIKNRSFSTNFDPPRLLVPTSKEIEVVLKKLTSYLQSARKNALKSYDNFIKQYSEFDKNCIQLREIIDTQKCLNSVFSINKKLEGSITIKIDGKSISLLSVNDVSWIINQHISEEHNINYHDDYYLVKIKNH